MTNFTLRVFLHIICLFMLLMMPLQFFSSFFTVIVFQSLAHSVAVKKSDVFGTYMTCELFYVDESTGLY